MLDANSFVAEQIYMTGPEALIARSATILAGAISEYARQVKQTTQPPGPDAAPLRWMVTGKLESPRTLKGPAVAGALAFSRLEASLLVSLPGEDDWMLDYGELREGGEAVVFLPSRTVLPSGSGERDLVGLVSDIVAIEQQPDEQSRVRGWLAYLENARVEGGRQAALRKLVDGQVEWKSLEAPLGRMMGDPRSSERALGYAFGIIAFGLTRDHWAKVQMRVAEFMCGIFDSESRPLLLRQYIPALRMAATRPDLRGIVAASLRRKKSSASATPELAQEYDDIRRQDPGLL
jgi:hypothetical protein